MAQQVKELATQEDLFYHHWSPWQGQISKMSVYNQSSTRGDKRQWYRMMGGRERRLLEALRTANLACDPIL